MAIKLEVNQRIQVSTSISGDGDAKKTYYPSRIEETTNDAIFIAEPLDGTVPVFLRSGQDIEVVFNDDTGTYRFVTRVLQRVERNIRMVKITKPETVEKCNRRDFFRLKVFIPFTFRVLPEETFKYGHPLKQEDLKKTILSKQLAFDESSKQEGIVKDLSGGGALVGVSENSNLRVGDHLEIWLPIGNDIVYLWGDVVRVMHNPDATKWNVDVGLYFSKVDERTRDLIISHILALQRELLQKGALD